MKKLITGLLIIFSHNAMAMFDLEPFIVGAVSYNQAKIAQESITLYDNNKKKTKEPGFMLGIGMNLHKYFGVELGYNFYSKMKLAEEHNLKLRNYYADLLGFYDLSQDFKLVVALGVGRLRTTVTKNDGSKPAAELTKRHNSLRYGIGGIFVPDDNLSLRVMLTQQKGNKTIKNVAAVNIGLLYKFQLFG